MKDLRIVSEPRTESGDATFVREGLALFNVAVTGDAYYSPLAIFLKDERGAVLGGALGHVWRGWLDLDTLCGLLSPNLAESRGRTGRTPRWHSRAEGRGLGRRRSSRSNSWVAE